MIRPSDEFIQDGMLWINYHANYFDNSSETSRRTFRYLGALNFVVWLLTSQNSIFCFFKITYWKSDKNDISRQLPIDYRGSGNINTVLVVCFSGWEQARKHVILLWSAVNICIRFISSSRAITVEKCLFCMWIKRAILPHHILDIFSEY